MINDNDCRAQHLIELLTKNKVITSKDLRHMRAQLFLKVLI